MTGRVRTIVFSLLALVLACGSDERLYDVIGVVEAVRPEDNQVIIAHEDIPGLMPAMTMNFDLEDPTIAERFSPGDAIRFELVFNGRAYLIRSAERLGEAEVNARKDRGELTRPADPVPDFELVNQRGEAVSSKGMRGKVLLIDFIYTHCPGPCPILTGVNAEANELIADLHDRVVFCSISLDPERDDPETLARYAEARGADAPNWHFLTGAPEVVADVIQRFGVASLPAADGEIDHTVARFLVDASGRIEERYMGLTHDAPKLAEAIRRVVERGSS